MSDNQQASHTTDLSIPAPWRLDDRSNAHVLDDDDGYHVIEGDGPTEHLRLTGFIPLDVARAITVAPEMLALVRRYASECAECGGEGEITITDDIGAIYATEACDACADIRAVIAKAEGRVGEWSTTSTL